MYLPCSWTKAIIPKFGVSYINSSLLSIPLRVISFTELNSFKSFASIQVFFGLLLVHSCHQLQSCDSSGLLHSPAFRTCPNNSKINRPPLHLNRSKTLTSEERIHFLISLSNTFCTHSSYHSHVSYSVFLGGTLRSYSPNSDP